MLIPIVTTLISDKEDFSTRRIIWGRKRHSRMIKGLTLQEDIIILTMYVPNNSIKYMRQN